jgi:MATE family multidrug resistance protein
MFSEIKKCLLLAIPLSLAQLAQGATGFVDTVMMGWLGSQTIASGGLGASIFGFCLLLFTGIVSAVSPLAAQAYGAGNQEKVGTIVRLGLGISLILAIPIALLFCNGGSLLLLLGQNAMLTQQH